MMKKALKTVLPLIMILLLCACGAQEAKNFTWNIEVRNAEVKEALHTDAGIPQYNGGILDKAYDNAPETGNVYVILTLTVTKTAEGGEAFRWENLTLTGSDGENYQRMENDSFLSSHTYNRMQGTPLMIGENKGSICFELPASAADGTMTLTYDAGEEGINKIKIKG